ncbi:diguanylate cyclase/phosphodiesterase with PAS/PAC sensor [Stanieria sp. NIES-3757]|nr:diguanylate cyclase/phosphodiesterase with PAS/PAC sensor [Stanieria sp. NIES-3757]
MSINDGCDNRCGLYRELEQQVQERTIQLKRVISELKQEISKHKQTQKQLFHQVLHDALTGLPNRKLFMEHLQKALQRSKRNQNYLFAVLFIDLDRFKIINDSLGHGVGDRLLIAIAHLLKQYSRDVDTVARLSGDEFALLLDDLKDSSDAVEIAERILEKISSPIALNERKVFTGASIGIALSSATYQNGNELLRDADIAMYRAKSQGKGRYAVFDRQMYIQTLHLSQLETDLRFALERQEFIVHYQPIISLKTGQLEGFEALLRWQHPEKGLIYPSEFIALAEDTGLIVPIGEWLLREVCSQLRSWQLQFPAAVSLQISVNLSSRQIQQFDFIDKLDEILSQTGLQGEYLRLELTETMLMNRGEKTLELLSQIKAKKIQLSIDDFGTGYSSLSYLHRFPIDSLKIDRSFVNSSDSKHKKLEIVSTIITLAHSLEIKAIAEGVETLERLNQLKNWGCDEAQGYLFSKPVDVRLAESFIALPIDNSKLHYTKQ